MIDKIKIKGLLSFGWEETVLELKPLNVLIGPNGSGKSNLLDVLLVLRNVPDDVQAPFRQGGSSEWINKEGVKGQIANIEMEFKTPGVEQSLCYRIGLSSQDVHMMVREETLRNLNEGSDLYLLKIKDGRGSITTSSQETTARLLAQTVREKFDPLQSVLSQRYEPNIYPEMAKTGDYFKSFHFYPNWIFGKNNPLRTSQKVDLPNQSLMMDFQNFGLRYSKLRKDIKTKALILEYLRKIYEGVEALEISVESNTVQLFLQEENQTFPATRLSDGTLRWISLITILCDPTPPPLICIEEPELGLHPDLIVTLADLLQEASQRTQLIVTTHSEVLVDALNDNPEAIVVCEKEQGATTFKRLSKEALSAWLKDYSLGQLWRDGEIGGNRW